MERVPVSDRSRWRIWLMPLAIVWCVLALLAIHYVFHRPVLPDLLIFLALIGIGVATRLRAIPNRESRKRKPTQRDA
jgi:hypothetical protein